MTAIPFSPATLSQTGEGQWRGPKLFRWFVGRNTKTEAFQEEANVTTVGTGSERDSCDFGEVRSDQTSGMQKIVEWSEELDPGIPQVSSEKFLTISRETLCEIEKEGFKSEVYTAARIARETFTNLHSIEITVQSDPEIPDRRKTRMSLTVSGQPEVVLNEESSFKKRLCRAISFRGCETISFTYRWKS